MRSQMSLSPRLQFKSSFLVWTLRWRTAKTRLPTVSAAPAGKRTKCNESLRHSTKDCHSFWRMLKLVARGVCKSCYSALNHAWIQRMELPSCNFFQDSGMPNAPQKHNVRQSDISATAADWKPRKPTTYNAMKCEMYMSRCNVRTKKAPKRWNQNALNAAPNGQTL